MDLVKDAPEVPLDDIQLDFEVAAIEALPVQPDGGGGDSGRAPPPTLQGMRNQSSHYVWDDEDWRVLATGGEILDDDRLRAEPEPYVLLEG